MGKGNLFDSGLSSDPLTLWIIDLKDLNLAKITRISAEAIDLNGSLTVLPARIS